MKLSIIVPVFDVEEYLPRCLDSILGQTFSDFQLLLVNDGSTDRSGEICNEYAKKDGRISVIHQGNAGQAVARNNAIKKVKGDYVGFVDSDDWINPHMYEKMMDAADRHCADIVVCRLQRISSTNDVISIIGYEHEVVMDRITATCEILRDEKMPSFPVNKIYKREVWGNLEFPKDRFFEDTATIYQAIYKSRKVVAIPYIGYNYLFNPNSTINNCNWDYQKRVKRELDNAIAFGERYMFCKNNPSLKEVYTTCAQKAYSRVRAFLHLQVHKKIAISDEQEKQLYNIMKSFTVHDLKNFSLGHKADLYLFQTSKSLLFLYLHVLSIIHPLNRDL